MPAPSPPPSQTSPPSTSFPPLHREDQSTLVRKQLAFYSALDKLLVESSLIMLAWKEIERDLEEAQQQQQQKNKKKRNGGAAAAAGGGGGGKDAAWWQGRLRALRERDWTMFSELERLRGEWGSLDGRKVSGARIAL